MGNMSDASRICIGLPLHDYAHIKNIVIKCYA